MKRFWPFGKSTTVEVTLKEDTVSIHVRAEARDPKTALIALAAGLKLARREDA